MAKVIGQTTDGKVLTLTVTREELVDWADRVIYREAAMGVEPGDDVDIKRWVTGFPGAITKSPLRPSDGADWAGSGPV